MDEDRSESYFCCAWSVEPNTDDALLAVAGQLGIIRIINLMEQRVTRTLMGHGNSINDLRFHPYQPTLLLSASKDESIRLWAVRFANSPQRLRASSPPPLPAARAHVRRQLLERALAM